MKIELLHQHWAMTPRHVQRVIKYFAERPTERNECYTIGYLTALNDSDKLADETYSYLLALCGQLRNSAEIRGAVCSNS